MSLAFLAIVLVQPFMSLAFLGIVAWMLGGLQVMRDWRALRGIGICKAGQGTGRKQERDLKSEHFSIFGVSFEGIWVALDLIFGAFGTLLGTPLGL